MADRKHVAVRTDTQIRCVLLIVSIPSKFLPFSKERRKALSCSMKTAHLNLKHNQSCYPNWHGAHVTMRGVGGVVIYFNFRTQQPAEWRSRYTEVRLPDQLYTSFICEYGWFYRTRGNNNAEKDSVARGTTSHLAEPHASLMVSIQQYSPYITSQPGTKTRILIPSDTPGNDHIMRRISWGKMGGLLPLIHLRSSNP